MKSFGLAPEQSHALRRNSGERREAADAVRCAIEAMERFKAAVAAATDIAQAHRQLAIAMGERARQRRQVFSLRWIWK